MTNEKTTTTRRQFLAAAGGVAAASVLPGVAKGFHNSVDDTIRVALVGCGGRGSGAAVNAVSAKGGKVKLIAMADVFEDRLSSSFDNLQRAIGDKMDVPNDRKFLGFDAYQHAMNVLRPGDVVILTTPPAFRWVHYTYAIKLGINVFMEKPLAVDGPAARRMLELNKQAMAKDMKVGVGLMSRHCTGMEELHDRIKDGAIGDIILMRGYRMHGPAGSAFSLPKPDDMTHLEYHIRRFHSFLWASGGCFNDFYIHHVDHLSWMKDMWPQKAQAVGGRHYRYDSDGKRYIDQNFDGYSVEYTYEDGTKFYFDGRCMNGAHGIYSSYVHGTKGCAVVARSNDIGGPQAIYSGQDPTVGQPVWQSTDRTNPYQNEWDVLIDKIRNNQPHNEVERGVYASASSSMGRMAAHTAQELTLDDLINCQHEFGPTVAELDYNKPSPLMPGDGGLYPIPEPGIKKDREY